MNEDDQLKSILLGYCGTPEERSYAEAHLGRFLESVRLIPREPVTAVLDLGTFRPLASLLHDVTAHRYAYHAHATAVPFVDAGGPGDFPMYRFDVELHRFPFEDGALGGVLCLEVLEHLGLDPSAMLSEMNRVLEPGGFLVLTTPNVVSARNLAKIFLGYSPHFYASFTLKRDRHNREYALPEVQLLLEAAGFTVETAATRDVYYPDADLSKHFPPEALEVLRSAPQPELRGDCIFLRARKTGPVRERYPAEFYDFPRPGGRGPGDAS
jgi:SAM-dependent methyltransferase